MLKYLVLVLSSLSGTTVLAGPPALDKSRTVVISGAIDSEALGPVATALRKLSGDGTGKPIDMIISSPGGEVMSGFVFLNLMEEVKAKGVAVHCYVPTLAASMAFQILVHCSKRYTLDNAFLLWHRARKGYMGIVTVTVASQMLASLAPIDNHILMDLKEALGKDLSDKEILRHFEDETFHIGRNLGQMAPHFIISYKAIPGLIELLKDPSVVRTGSGAEERIKEQAAQGAPMHILRSR